MTAVSKVTISPDWRSRLHLIRPRFVYLWVRLWALPIPIVLFAPLVMLEFFLVLGTRILRKAKAPDPQIVALRGQIWELRRMPPFVLLEAEVRPRAFDARAPQQVYVKIGLW
ncbi:hypothetical protein [Meiothermus ruber]|uniref:hypothetical protein n=1 Tax=Meiothermus ruber TaxID=277 RepID=UPI00034D3013|nr:hypothetical protein [Meiothermus ruber]GAO74916.1 putative uncharacterized protein [Meiothermus ruber H328]